MHKTTSRFWKLFQQLPESVQNTTRQNFDLLKVNPRYGSLHFKKVGKFWSARVGQDYRALAIKMEMTSHGFGLVNTVIAPTT